MRTVRLTIAYDGTEYVGWQRQDTGPSIQGCLEEALSRIDGRAVTLHGAGRTDAGVHALGQVASARMHTPLADTRLARALNAHLPEAIRVVHLATVPDDFHARFSARGKTYEYRIWNGPVLPPFLRLYTWHRSFPLDVALMQQAADATLGAHDFAAFRSAPRGGAATAICWCSRSRGTASCATWSGAWSARWSRLAGGGARRRTSRGC
jgi:tRNA pseudouridine38-40 synthase